MVAQGMLLAVSPVLTRLYTPAQFGLLGTYSAIAGILVVMAGLRFDAAIPLPRTDDDAMRLLALSLGSAFVTAALTGCLVTLGGDALCKAVGMPGLGTWLWFLPPAVLGGSAYQALSYWQVRRGGYSTIARTKMVQSTTAVTVQAALGGLAGPAGLFLGDLLQRSVGALWLARDGAAQMGRGTVTLSGCLQVARVYRRFPLVSSWSAVANIVPLIGLPALIAVLYGAPEAGAVVVAQRVVDLPVALVGAAAGQVFFGQAASAVREDPSQAIAYFDAAVRRLLPVSALFTVATLALPPLAFEPVFGAEWGDAARLAQLLGVAAAFRLVVSPISQLHLLAGRQTTQLVADGARLLVVGLAILTARALWGGNAVAAVAAYAVAMSVSYICFLAFYRNCALQVAKRPRR